MFMIDWLIRENAESQEKVVGFVLSGKICTLPAVINKIILPTWRRIVVCTTSQALYDIVVNMPGDK